MKFNPLLLLGAFMVALFVVWFCYGQADTTKTDTLATPGYVLHGTFWPDADDDYKCKEAVVTPCGVTLTHCEDGRSYLCWFSVVAEGTPKPIRKIQESEIYTPGFIKPQP